MHEKNLYVVAAESIPGRNISAVLVTFMVAEKFDVLPWPRNFWAELTIGQQNSSAGRNSSRIIFQPSRVFLSLVLVYLGFPYVQEGFPDSYSINIASAYMRFCGKPQGLALLLATKYAPQGGIYNFLLLPEHAICLIIACR